MRSRYEQRFYDGKIELDKIVQLMGIINVRLCGLLERGGLAESRDHVVVICIVYMYDFVIRYRYFALQPIHAFRMMQSFMTTFIYQDLKSGLFRSPLNINNLIQPMIDYIVRVLG